MKFYTTCFRQVPFLSKYHLPLSTAVYDPSWFHNFRHESHKFLNNHHVIYGMRFMEAINCVKEATKACPCKGIQYCQEVPTSCGFLSAYRENLDKLNFPKCMEIFESLLVMARERFGEGDWKIVFVFCEAESTACSERSSFQNWLRANGQEVAEIPLILRPDYSIPQCVKPFAEL